MAATSFSVSRRATLKGLAGLVIGMYLPLPRAFGQGPPRPPMKFPANAYVRVAPDNTLTVICKHIEFGQGPFTGLATLVAEEMDADWSQVRAEHAPANAELYANFAFGIQGTGGSSAIANSYEQMRRAGATARAMLVSAAAQQWKVPAAQIEVSQGVIRHAKSGRQGTFGEFALAAAKLPVPANVKLKDPATFKLIGRDTAGANGKLDSKAKSNGSALFTLDIHEPGMLTAVVARPPRFGGKVASFDDAATRKVAGVVEVKQIPEGIAVYGTHTWAALKGRQQLKVTWDDSAAEKRGSEQLIGEYRALCATPGLTAGTHGDAEAALAKATKVIEHEFVFPYLAHAPMEPLDGYIRWTSEGALARFGSQMQTPEQLTIAKVLGLPPERVELRTEFAGGSFGRRAQSTMHFAAELAHVGKALGPDKPVKLMWTREDDLHGGYYRPLGVHRMRGAVRDGKIVAWASNIAVQSFIKTSPFAAMMKDGIDPTACEGASELLYEVADFRCGLHMPDVNVPTLWWRSVGHSHTGYAVESFMDILLREAGKDPVAGRLELMGKQPRAAGALRAVAELANWTGPGPLNGRARGVAVVESFDSFVAQIAEVSLGDNGEPRVHKVWCAVDCGVAVNPDVIRAQMQGGIGYGLGHALYAEQVLDAGRPVHANFNSYRSLRINEMPEIEVVIVKSSAAPTGVGEPGVPPIAPAVANALALLGARPFRLPMVRSKA